MDIITNLENVNANNNSKNVIPQGNKIIRIQREAEKIFSLRKSPVCIISATRMRRFWFL